MMSFGPNLAGHLRMDGGFTEPPQPEHRARPCMCFDKQWSLQRCKYFVRRTREVASTQPVRRFGA